MQELTNEPLKQKMDPSRMGNDALMLRALVGDLNNPAITGAVAPPPEDAPVFVPPPLPTPAPPPEPTPSPAPSPKAKVATNRFLFTGYPGAGKTWLAEKMGLNIFELVDPILRMACTAFQKSIAYNTRGIEPFLNDIWAWGEGIVSDQFPYTVQRAFFLENLWKADKECFPMFRVSTQQLFGKPGFWIASLQARVKHFLQESPGNRVGVTNIHRPEDYQLLTKAGFRPYHIMCSSATRQARGAVGLNSARDVADMIEQDVTRKISQQPRGSGLWCVWNDPDHVKPSERILSVDTFLQITSA